MKRLLIIAAALIACMAAVYAISVSVSDAQAPNPEGNYQAVVNCGNYQVGITAMTPTFNGTPVPLTPVFGMECSPAGGGRTKFKMGSQWNDLRVQYWCKEPTPGVTPTPNTLEIPATAGVVLDKWYTLVCKSTGITHTPQPGDPPGDAQVQIDLSKVGGIAEAPDGDAAALGATDSGGSSGTTNAAIAVVAVGLIVLGTGGWYARRRWLS